MNRSALKRSAGRQTIQFMQPGLKGGARFGDNPPVREDFPQFIVIADLHNSTKFVLC